MPTTPGQPQLQAAQASGEATLTKPRQPLLFQGSSGRPRKHLHCLRSLLVQVAGWDWLQGLRPSHPRCTLASRLAASRASVLACFLQPGARGGPAGGRGCCTAEGSSCWHPWWWRRQQGAGARDPIRSPGSERRGNARASMAGARRSVCVIVARAALPGARECELERRCGPKDLLLTAPD